MKEETQPSWHDYSLECEGRDTQPSWHDYSLESEGRDTQPSWHDYSLECEGRDTQPSWHNYSLVCEGRDTPPSWHNYSLECEGRETEGLAVTQPSQSSIEVFEQTQKTKLMQYTGRLALSQGHPIIQCQQERGLERGSA